MDIEFTFEKSTLGAVLIAQSAKGLCAVLMGDNCPELTTDLRRRFPKHKIGKAKTSMMLLADRVVQFIEDPSRDFDHPIDLVGTEFQVQVWRALLEIPAGVTESYTTVANRIGQPRAYRAVASACAANHLAVVVPCHRVVSSTGKLTGYRWGIERKRSLLMRECGAITASQ